MSVPPRAVNPDHDPRPAPRHPRPPRPRHRPTTPPGCHATASAPPPTTQRPPSTPSPVLSPPSDELETEARGSDTPRPGFVPRELGAGSVTPVPFLPKNTVCDNSRIIKLLLTVELRGSSMQGKCSDVLRLCVFAGKCGEVYTNTRGRETSGKFNDSVSGLEFPALPRVRILVVGIPATW